MTQSAQNRKPRAAADEAALAEWARRFDALFTPEERAALDAMAARELAEGPPPTRPRSPRPRAAGARARPRTWPPR